MILSSILKTKRRKTIEADCSLDLALEFNHSSRHLFKVVLAHQRRAPLYLLRRPSDAPDSRRDHLCIPYRIVCAFRAVIENALSSSRSPEIAVAQIREFANMVVTDHAVEFHLIYLKEILSSPPRAELAFDHECTSQLYLIGLIHREVCHPKLMMMKRDFRIMFGRITNLFRSEQDVPDRIEVLGLRKWYLNLDDGQRQKLHNHSTWFGTGGEENLLEQKVESTTQTASEYLKGVGSTAVKQKDYDFAEMVLLSALELDDGSATSTHFAYNGLINLYYKQRDERDDAIEECIKYCKKDIEIADDFVDEFGEVPVIPSFKRLAIIYEKQERYEDAVDVCEQALKFGTTDGTKGGFEGRKERLRKKMKS